MYMNALCAEAVSSPALICRQQESLGQILHVSISPNDGVVAFSFITLWYGLKSPLLGWDLSHLQVP